MKLLYTQWPQNQQPFRRLADRLKELQKRQTLTCMKCSNSFQKEEAATEVTILQLQGGGLQKAKK